MQGKWQAADGTWAEFLANYNDYDVTVEYPADDEYVVTDGRDGSELNDNRFIVKSGSIVMVKKIYKQKNFKF